jgi:dihydroorotase
MNTNAPVTVLRNARVIDPAGGIDRVTDVTLAGGRIAAVGDRALPEGADVIDLTGHVVSPGWIDLHVHAYGTLGFADPDSIGIAHGVTTFVEAGGPGIATLDEFIAMMGGRTQTSLYAGVYLRPMGIIGLTFVEEDTRNLGEIPLGRWLDAMAEHGDLIRYLKMGAFAKYGTGPLRLGKGLAEILGIPLYLHIGEFGWHEGALIAHDAFAVADAGDIITHVYHRNRGHILDDDGRVLPVVRDAAQRGVLFDVGFGGYNFAWDVAEKGYAQGLAPHIISSDLQQFNVTGPTYSLANVLSVFDRLGMPLADIVERVTIAPARALHLDDRAGSLTPGMPADVTVFRFESGSFELAGCFKDARTAERRIVPVMAFKAGARVDCDLDRCQDDRNRLLQIAEEAPPAASARLAPAQLGFLRSLAAELAGIEWEMSSPRRQDLVAAGALQAAVRRAQAAHGLALRDALTAVYDCFLEQAFAIQIGLFLLRLDRRFVLERLDAVGAQAHLAASS